jgi:hypothetical protein
MPRRPIGKLDTSSDQDPKVDRSVITTNIPQLCVPGLDRSEMTSSRRSFGQDFFSFVLATLSVWRAPPVHFCYGYDKSIAAFSVRNISFPIIFSL